MCPDRQIISLYLDGELPSPWKEKMGAHLETCPQCRAILAGYGKLGEKLRCVPDESGQAAMERVWAKLCFSKPLTEAGTAFPGKFSAPENRTELPFRQDGRKKQIRFRYRTVTLPLPVAAASAAAVLIIVGFFALMGIRGGGFSQSHDQMVAAGIGLDDQGMVPLDDMSEVLQYLSSQDNGDFMVIRLPESRRFSRPGEPTLINAADYSRTRRNFQR